MGERMAERGSVEQGRCKKEGSCSSFAQLTRDIAERKAVEERLREGEELYRSILNASPDDITITDLEGRLLLVSPAAHRLFGYPDVYDIKTLTIDAFIAPEDHVRAKASIQRMHEGSYFGPNQYRGLRRDGSLFDIEVNSGFVRDANGDPSKMVFVVRDVTERVVAQQQIEGLVRQLETEKAYAQTIALTDGLTGLANRRALDRALLAEFSRYKRFGVAFSILLLDIDRFKRFNDHYGHLAGDCLRKVAEQLTTTVGRQPDFVARYGGEEFVVILPGTDAAGAALLANRIIASMSALAIPHGTSETALHLTVSIGLATATPELSSHEDLMRLADQALYVAKGQGRNRVSGAALLA